MTSEASAAHPATRKVWQYNRAGSMPEILEQKTVPVPSVPKNGYLIRVAAVGINPTDYKNVDPSGPTFAIRMPVIPCSDFSGVVVGGPKDGLEVYGHIPTEQTLLWHGQGSLAEYIVATPPLVFPKPPHLSFEASGSVGLTGLTSWMCLVDHANLQAGQRVFINGGSGGAGLWGIKIAKALGGHVVSTCSEHSRELVLRAGADEVVDYRAVDLVEHLKANYSSPDKQFDVIYDCAGLTPALYPSSPVYLKPSGIFVDICAMATPEETGGRARSLARLLERSWRPSWLGGTPRRYKSALLLAHNSKADFAKLDALIREKSLEPILDSVFPFDEAPQAFERLMQGRAKGKIVIRVSDQVSNNAEAGGATSNI